MHGLVFAAGRGTRLRPYTDGTPKPLLEVGGQPLLARCVRAVVDAGVEAITIVVGYRGGEIVDHFGDDFEGVSITYAHQREREGLAHAVLAAEAHVEGDVLAVNGDNVFDGDLSALVDRHRESDVDGTVLLDRAARNEAETTGLCDVAPDGTIREVESSLESPDAGHIAAGAQTHPPALFDACRAIERADSGEYELVDALQHLVDRGRRYVGVELDGWHLNVNTPADLERARQYVSDSAE
ncbi:sugar phosphate nucleotidyltransferase [Natronobeatus ordinarius]|uniref:sugar phosphate nucleotidyltransferase n=1 Tax=Natronobeatus ordinarius TaxID=2963433 RepID=UPI0020CC8000|nr:sugar phosphate nucleotidyltransferase [Natronobeatus ordinarius]